MRDGYWQTRGVALSSYRKILTIPGVLPLNLLGIVARLPHAATSVILTLHVTQTLGRGYAMAGLVITVWTVGLAIGSPWRGRVIDRMGMRRAMLPSVIAEVLVWSATPWLPLPAFMCAVFIGGIFGLPAFTIVRLALAQLVKPALHRTAFALDSVIIEISFILGPTLGVIAATQWDTSYALIALGVCAAAAGLGLMKLNLPQKTTADAQLQSFMDAATSNELTGSATCQSKIKVTSRLIWVMLAALGGTLVLAGTDVTLVATLRASGELGWTGLLVSVWAASSVIGGLIYGTIARPVSPFFLLLGLSVLTIPLVLGSGPLTFCLALIPAGLLCAPTLAATAEALHCLVPEQSRGEALGWQGSAFLIGSAIGAPAAGAAIDFVGNQAGFIIVSLLGGLIALAGLISGGLKPSHADVMS